MSTEIANLPGMSDEDQVEERISVASQSQLIWWRFRKHRLALISAVVIILFYLVVLFAEFLAIADPETSDAKRGFMPPQPLYFFDEGRFSPHVCAVVGGRDPQTFKKIFEQDCESKIPVKFFASGFSYEWLGLIPTDLHLMVPEGWEEDEKIFLLGTDLQGRDMYSRLMYGTRISMSIGLVGVGLSLILGVVLGGVSGYYGGMVDNAIQRLIEIVRAVPTIPLWMGLAAALPREWGVLQVYFAITLIISLVAWTDLARVVRGRFLALREEDFVTAGKLAGVSQSRIIFRHMLPSFYSHIIAAVTLAIPVMIISETSLSFLGLGLRPPAISWGTLLQGAQNIQSVALTPWLLLPAVPVIVAILALNFLGDGLRDAADPYST